MRLKNFLISTDRINAKIRELNDQIEYIQNIKIKYPMTDVVIKYLSELKMFYEREIERRNGNKEIENSIMLNNIWKYSNRKLKNSYTELRRIHMNFDSQFHADIPYMNRDRILRNIEKIWELYIAEIFARGLNF